MADIVPLPDTVAVLTREMVDVSKVLAVGFIVNDREDVELATAEIVEVCAAVSD